MVFRDRLVATLNAAAPALASPGVMIVGSEVPNLLEPDAASSLVVSLDLDLGVPVDDHPELKRRLPQLRQFRQSSDEPSVWIPRSPDLLELNFVGMDRGQDPSESYVLEDDELPLLVFGALSFVRPGPRVVIAGTSFTLPRPSGLLLEKLVTDRTGEKGDRDLLVALGVLMTSTDDDIVELEQAYRTLRPELRHSILSNLTLLSLLEGRNGMPDPGPWRERVSALIRRLESAGGKP
jgi:hypothetical protein